VPGLPGNDRIEVSSGGVPSLEGRHLDLDPAAACKVGHPRVGLDPEHLAAGSLELPGFYAGTDADVEDVGSGAGGDDAPHHGVGVAGPGPVVAFGIRAEGLSHLSVSMWLVLGRRFGGHAPIVMGMHQLINRVGTVESPDLLSAVIRPPSGKADSPNFG